VRNKTICSILIMRDHPGSLGVVTLNWELVEELLGPTMRLEALEHTESTGFSCQANSV
jgi:hypothetical protein